MDKPSPVSEKYWLASILVGVLILIIRLNLNHKSNFQSLYNWLSKHKETIHSIKRMIFGTCILVAPSLVYFISSYAPSVWDSIKDNEIQLRITTTILTVLIASTSAFIAISSFRQNLELRYFENITKKYEALRNLFDRDVLDKPSLDQIVVTIKNVRNLKKVMPKKFLKELMILDENSTLDFIREKIKSSSLKYFTGYETFETIDKVVDKLTDTQETLVVDLTDPPRAMHDRLLNRMRENDDKQSVTNKRERFVSKIEIGEWQFKSGLNLEYIFIILAFIYELPLNLLNERMRNQKINKLKYVRREYPRLTACLYYLWEVHDEGQTFPHEIE